MIKYTEEQLMTYFNDLTPFFFGPKRLPARVSRAHGSDGYFLSSHGFSKGGNAPLWKQFGIDRFTMLTLISKHTGRNFRDCRGQWPTSQQVTREILIKVIIDLQDLVSSPIVKIKVDNKKYTIV